MIFENFGLFPQMDLRYKYFVLKVKSLIRTGVSAEDSLRSG